ncbi:cytochrome c [Myxococcota bacterium]|nr:cytochrome c [Myxococcota bacterium]
MRRLLLVSLVFCTVLAAAGCSHVRMALFMRKENPTARDPESISRGRLVFAENCASCHGERADGAGPRAASTLKTVPTNFLSPEYTKSAERIAARIAYGRGNEMPAFAGQLPEQAIWDTANYLRSLQTPAAR